MTSSSDEEITVLAEIKTSPNKVNQRNVSTSNLTSDGGESVEMGMDNFIRVRSEGDGIFEDDDDDEFDDDYSQLDTETEPVCDSLPSRKRKQEMDTREIELIEFMDDEPEFRRNYLEPDIFQMRRRDRVPLYLLNPDDYPQEPEKRHQIRRAKITYRYHQEKKAQIIALTEESKKLREHVELLKAKVLELAGCRCRKNKLVKLDVLYVEIPIVPPRMYVRGNRPILAASYNNLQFPMDHQGPSSSLSEKTQQLFNAFDPATSIIKVPQIPKPLVNIASNRLNQISSTTLSSVNVARSMSPSPSAGSHVVRFGGSGNQVIYTRVPQRVTNFLEKHASGSETTTQAKTEPGTISNQSMTASRIVFAKGNPPLQTASQMLFASNPNPALKSNPPQYGLSVSQRPLLITPPATPTLPINTCMTPLRPGVPTGVVGSVVRTASGQVLHLIEKPNPLKTVPGPSKFPVPKYRQRPILPKPESSNEVTSPPTKQITKEDLKDMWSRFDDDDEDELAIIAAIHDRSPSPLGGSTSISNSTRRQAMGRNESFEDEFDFKGSAGNIQVVRSNGTEIELSNYADIVIEEAN